MRFCSPDPTHNTLQWFTDYLSDLCEDDHLHRYMDIRVFLTNIDSPPDQLASVLLQLGLKTAGESCIVRRPSQPQLNNLFNSTSYGVPDYTSIFDCKSNNLLNEYDTIPRSKILCVHLMIRNSPWLTLKQLFPIVKLYTDSPWFHQ